MDFLNGFLSNISRDLVCGVVNQLRYPCCFNNFVEELKKEEEDLIATRNSVQDRVAHGKKQAMKTAEVVHKWLKDADIGIEDVNNLLDKAITKKSCCSGHCPNWILRYHLGKKLANKKKELGELIKKGEPFVQLERVATLPSETLYFPSDKYLKFESREYAYEQVMEAVKDEEVNMIGLYGMGGCGKTTLAEEVKKIAEAENLFDKVLFVTVSSTVEVRRIQEKIASSMQYNFQQNEERDRARALYMRLTQENKILVILDDVWEVLDFGAIGIPLTAHHKGCKVLITTRSEDVCTLMDCQNKIQLQILTDEETWSLFQKQAHISADTSDSLKHLAREISDECKGLPVAIAAVACSLKGKDEVIWKAALNRLRNSKPMNIEKGLRDPYNCLQLSYDNLDIEEAKSLFLLSSVFPGDYKIRTEDLIKLAIGLGVVGEVRSYDEAKSEVIAAKIKLVSSCLLMLDADYCGYECVKMHDLVRDVAHFIAKDENKVIKCQLDNDVTLEESSIRYLWCKKLPNDLDYSNLEFLCVATNLEVLDENFKRMGKLRVLRLINEEWKKLQLSTMSFKTLINLSCLILDKWELSDISFVRDTKKLQSLSLHNCSLPSFLDLQTDEVYEQLTKLKLLELVECEMERSNYNVIGRILQLEELCIIDSDVRWDDGNEDTIEFVKTFRVPQALQCFVIILGHFMYNSVNVPFSREGTLTLDCFHISNEAIMNLAKRAKVVGMRNIKGGAKNIIPDIFQMKEGNMTKLNDLQISYSDDIECLVDTSNHLNEVGSLFSELLQLSINDLSDLRVIWHGCLPPRGTFQKLEALYLSYCPELTSLFTHTSGPFTLSNLTSLQIESCWKLSSLFTVSTAKTLTSLKELTIKYCNDLKNIVAGERVHNNEKDDIVEDDHDFQSAISMFPSLQTVDINQCAKLEIIFPLCCLPELESLKIRECGQLKQIMEQDLLEDQNLSNLLSPQPRFPKLVTLDVEKCNDLKSVFSASTSIDLSNLEILIINKCSELEELIRCQHGKGHQIENVKVELPQAIVPSPVQSTIFQNLQKVTITECRKLKYVFSANTVRGLPQLKELFISGCNQLDQIIEDNIPSAPVMNNAHAQHDQNEITPENTSIPSASLMNHSPGPLPLFNLTSLKLESCQKLRSLFTVSTAKTLISLKELIIKYCGDLKHIVTPKRGQKNEKEEIGEDDHNLQSVISMIPNLKTLKIEYCAKLEAIFPPCCLPELESLEIRRCIELKQIMKQDLEEDQNLSNHLSPQPYFPKLAKLVVEDCNKLKSVLPTSASIGLSNLEILIIDSAAELEELIECQHEKGHEIEKVKAELSQAIVPSPVRSTIFQNLQQVTIRRCGKLKYVFPANTVRGLPKLKELCIKDCNELDQIIGDIIRSAPSVMSNAQHDQHEIIPEDTSIPSASLANPGPFTLSNLTSLKLESCPKLSSLFTESTAKSLTSLKTLTIENCDGLKHIITLERAHKKEKEDIVEVDHDLRCVISIFPSLKRVYITRCARLEEIFPLSCQPELMILFTSLEALTIENCDDLKHIITLERDHKKEKEDMVDDDHDLQCVISTFPSLKWVYITRCAILEEIFPLSCQPELMILEIRECKELKQIMEQDLDEDKNLSNLVSPQPHFPKLTKLVVENCHKLKRVFSTSASIGLSNMEILIINGAAELEELIGCEHGKGHEIEKAKFEFPKLKLLIFMHLPNICQGIELLAVKHRIVHNCPKLALSSTTTLQELQEKFPDSDFENVHLLPERELRVLIDQINE